VTPGTAEYVGAVVVAQRELCKAVNTIAIRRHLRPEQTMAAIAGTLAMAVASMVAPEAQDRVLAILAQDLAKYMLTARFEVARAKARHPAGHA
jgi:hypothetical protein